MDTFSWEEAKQWQAAIGAGIGAFFGFLSLMVAALWNFSLNRRRDRQLRNEELVSVAAALYGEILLLRGELALLASTIAYHVIERRPLREIDQFTYAPSTPLLYPALAHKLGLLPSDLLLGITKFYAHVEGARRGLESYRRTREEDFQYNVRIVLDDAVGGVTDVKPVLRRVEELASIPQARDPDTGRAEDVLEREELMDEWARASPEERRRLKGE